MPDVVCCVFQYNRGKYQHTGLHIGGGVIIHCAYNDAGVQYGNISDTAWTHYAIPAGLYTAEEIAAAGKAADNVVFTLRSGSKGDDVVKLQTALNALGYDCGEADGIFGAKTEAAVRNFQRDHSLTVDGIAGRDTQAALYATDSETQPTYTVTLRNVPQADAIALTAKYAGEMAQEGGA
ncbi:MAG: peptidoglycan-binding protein [Eubacteriales bacterium]|nr:peptidoglycan-binding protein [Eubacteriales bacterium]